MKKIIGNPEGFTLIIVTLVLALVSILGFAIMGVAMSNFNMTKIDSKSQSAYYIAEAGINYVIDDIYTWIEDDENIDNNNDKEEFFGAIENEFCNAKPTKLEFKEYKENSGIIPLAQVTVTRIAGDGDDEDIRDYRIESLGQIGKSKRKASAKISLTWSGGETDIGVNIDDVFIYSESYSELGHSINGKGGTVIIGSPTAVHDGTVLNVTDIYFMGSMNYKLNLLGNSEQPGKIYVEENLVFGAPNTQVHGDVYVGGDFIPGGASFKGNIYVEGDVYLGGTGSWQIKYIKAKNFIDANNNKINIEGYGWGSKLEQGKVEIPTIPYIAYKLRNNEWYGQNDYTLIETGNWGTISKGTKIISKGDFKGMADNPGGEIIIISREGNINITAPNEGTRMKGALIAPNGKVEIEQENFEGLIISKNGFKADVHGGTQINMLKPSQIFGPNKENWPFKVDSGSTGGNNNGSPSNGNTNLKIKKPIREE